ncbi:putative mitochondrial outer membrane protein [Xylona heveae TC161]|uniref:Putative mitochondrial outer membrane protein n=1 Tax=Xylona heveae (strain CBS 132557 / TC161) TaxID=1328760 RepID=A0A165H2M9_XYLHT|nr:putative mitochondrial outer membrane protein [Xylona heveae TC161]KZF22900.1 putative mitochondrial outer membrane protein [Xylona heveae TC161]
MASAIGGEDDIFENLKQRVDPKVQEERDQSLNARIQAQYQKAQNRLAELLDSNSTLPVTISSISVVNAPHTRKSFLQRIFNPLLSVNRDQPYTLSEALREISVSADKLSRFDIFHPPISLYIDQPSASDASTTPSDIAIYLSVREKSRLLLKTGTDLGNAEGSAYGNLLWRNIFGGAETLNLNASLGTRTRSAYSASFDTPILSNPDLRWEIGGLASSTHKSWANHEEVLKGGSTKLRWLNSQGHRFELGYSGIWRQITGLGGNASPTVRGDAGDSVKSSITSTWINDRRDNPLLPSSGYLMKTISEVAGYGPLRGDVAFWKSELETQTALSVPVPGINGVTFTTGLRAGLLWPLAFAGQETAQPSRINDRFQLGGPTDVRGFRLSGIGPRDGSDAVGGDVFAAGSANLLFPLPMVGAEKPLRLQAFVNGGRLLALKDTSGEGKMDSDTVKNNVSETIRELANGYPSMAAGVGLVYAHPVARFELNFSLPLVIRKGEEGRKGLQLGVGISFL